MSERGPSGTGHDTAEEVKQLREALEEFADVRNWAVSRAEFVEPAHIWIGTYRKHPTEIAKEALRGR